MNLCYVLSMTYPIPYRLIFVRAGKTVEPLYLVFFELGEEGAIAFEKVKGQRALTREEALALAEMYMGHEASSEERAQIQSASQESSDAKDPGGNKIYVDGKKLLDGCFDAFGDDFSCKIRPEKIAAELMYRSCLIDRGRFDEDGLAVKKAEALKCEALYLRPVPLDKKMVEFGALLNESTWEKLCVGFKHYETKRMEGDSVEDIRTQFPQCVVPPESPQR